MKANFLVTFCLCAVIAGCYYYPPYYYDTAPPGGFDRSWSAAVGAFRDQGVWIAVEDRGAGYLRGTRGGSEVTADVRTRGDGSVRVEFNTAGEKGHDPDLINRVVRSYNRRMGR